MVPKPTHKAIIIFLFFACIAGTSAVGQAPGGISTNLRWWLKADAGVYIDNGTTLATDGQAVQQWNDQSAVANHARQTSGANKPVYRTGILNGNPVLRFSRNQFIDGLAVSGIGPIESFYMFLVFKQNSWVAGGTMDGNGTFIIDRPTGTINLTSFKMVSTNKYLYQRRTDSGGSLGGPSSTSAANTSSFVIVDYFRDYPPSQEGIHLNGKIDVLNGSAPNGNITGPIVRIGRHATTANGGLDGDFAEMVIYNAALSATDRRKVESYLAIKYGISLDPGLDYFRSDGTVIYPATSTHSGYVTDIAGIGRDNGGGGSALLQADSRSQNANSVVRIHNASSLGNLDFLVWGSNNGTLTPPNAVDVMAQ